MRTKWKKAIVVFCMFCMLNILTAGCGADSASLAKAMGDEGSVEKSHDTSSPDDESAKKLRKDSEDGDSKELNDPQENTEGAKTGDAEASQENAEGRWHVFDSETAAAVDADFEGVVWHIAEGAFSVAETKVQVLEDGSLVCSAPSASAVIPDSELIHVVVDDDTYFYIRTIYGNGESHEDAEAGFGDLKEHMSVEMKGKFENDVFYASEIRLIKIS